MQHRNHRVSPQPVPKSSSQAKRKLFKLTNQWGAGSDGQRGWLGRSVCMHFAVNIPSKDTTSIWKLSKSKLQKALLAYWWNPPLCHHGLFWDPGKNILGWAHVCKTDFQSLSFMLPSSMLRAELQKLGPSIPAFKQLVCFGRAEPDCTYQWNSIIRVIKYLNGN